MNILEDESRILRGASRLRELVSAGCIFCVMVAGWLLWDIAINGQAVLFVPFAIMVTIAKGLHMWADWLYINIIDK